MQVKATIRDPSGAVVAVGHAEEQRGATTINRSSCLENAETSAVGRCLAFLSGDLAGTDIASADELAQALAQQREAQSIERLRRHNAAVREHIESIVAIKEFLALGEYGSAYEAISELPTEDWQILWVAPSKGGIWTTKERAEMKSDEFNEARKAHHGGTE